MIVRSNTAGLDQLYGKVTRRILPLLIFGYIVAYLDRVNVGFAKLQMLDDLQFGETVYGLGAGIFFIGYFLFEVPSNLILNRVGARVWIARIMISWGLVSAALMFVNTSATFYALRFLLGVAEAGFFPGIIFYLTLWYPAERRGRITAIFMTGIAISSAIGSLLSGWIMQTFDGANGWAGWQWLFLLEGLPAVVMGLIVLRFLDDDIGKAKWLNDDEKKLLGTELAKNTSSQPKSSFHDAMSDGRVWFGCLIYFCIITGLYGVSFWLPTIVSDMGIKNPAQIGLLTAIPYTIAAVGMVLVGRSSDRRNERRWHIAVPAALAAIGLVASVMLTSDLILALAALSLATFGILTAAPLFWSLPSAYLSGAAAAAGIAIINSFGNLAGFVSPYLVGWLKEATGSTAPGMFTIAGSLVLAAMFVLLTPPRHSGFRRNPVDASQLRNGSSEIGHETNRNSN